MTWDPGVRSYVSDTLEKAMFSPSGKALRLGLEFMVLVFAFLVPKPAKLILSTTWGLSLITPFQAPKLGSIMVFLSGSR